MHNDYVNICAPLRGNEMGIIHLAIASFLAPRRFRAAAIIALLGIGAISRAEELEFSFYLGGQGAVDSLGQAQLPGGGTYSRLIDWQGLSFSRPLYYGMRASLWEGDRGIAIEATHNKVYSSASDRRGVFRHLEFSDGHNIITANAMQRWPDALGHPRRGASTRVTPYIGAGIGVAVPHVDIIIEGAKAESFGYRLAGPAMRSLLGAKFEIDDGLAFIAEYQTSWSHNKVSIDPDPGEEAGRFRTRIITHALNLGLSARF